MAHPSEPTVCVKSLRGALFAGAVRTGLPMPELAARLGLSPAVLADASARFTHGEVVRLWDELARRADDPSFGLFAAQVISGAPLDLIDYALQHAANVEEMNQLFARYQVLFHDANDSYREVGPDAAAWVLRFRGDLPRSRHLVEFVLATWLTRVRRCTGRSLVPRAVELAHPAPARPGLHAQLFGAPVTFDAGRDALVVDKAVLSWPLQGADPALKAAFEKQAEQELHARATEADFLGQARERLQALTLQGHAGIAELAKALAVSERTLQRRLQEHGTTFQEQLDRVRHELALAQLRRAGATVTDVAFVLGFSDLSAFSRAFRRWTGQSPQEFLRAAG